MTIFIVAEIGINHNGDIGITKDLIKAAKDAGCDAVKFQKRTIDLVYTQDFLDGTRESPWGTTQREQKEGLEFGLDEYQEIDSYSKEIGIEWFASSWDVESQKLLRQFDLKYNKHIIQLTWGSYRKFIFTSKNKKKIKVITPPPKTVLINDLILVFLFISNLILYHFNNTTFCD